MTEESADAGGPRPDTTSVPLPPDAFTLLDALRDVVIIGDRRGRVVHVNRAIEAVLGWAPADLVGGPLLRLIPPSLRDAHLAAFEKVMAGGPPTILGGDPVTVPALHRDGGEVEFELSLAEHAREDDDSWIIATLRETRTRRRLERAESRSRYLALNAEVMRRIALTEDVHSVHEAGEIILEAVGEMLGWHAAVLWQVDGAGTSRPVGGWSLADLDAAMPDLAGPHLRFDIGRGLPGRVVASRTPAWIEDVTQDADFPRGPIAIAHGVTTAFAFPIHGAGRVVAVIELLRRGQRPVDAILLGIVGQIGANVGLFLERRRAEDELAANKARKAAMLDSTSDAVLAIDHAGIIREWNPAAEVTFGWPAAEALGRPMVDLIVPERFRTAHLESFERHLRTGEARILGRPVELVARRRAGDEIPVEISITRLTGVEPPEFIGFVRDITERKEAERALAESRDHLRRVAELLQESLLPTELPRVPGLELGAAYRPAGDGSLIGGDVYDVLHVDGSRWAAFVGDVCGKGAEAARVTALVRYTLRAMAMQDRDPREAVLRCNAALLDDHAGRFVSLAHLTVDVGEVSTIRLVRAGHPPPLVLRRDGRIERVEGPGTIIGVLEEPTLEVAEVELRPGDALVLYTDGVTDADVGGQLLGDDGLLALVRATSGLSAAQMAAALHDRVVDLQHGDTRDDLAILVLRQPER